MISRDDHTGLPAARKAVFGGIPWKRCQFHLKQNATAYVPKVEMRTGVTRDIRVILDAPDDNNALEVLRLTIAKGETTAPKLARWMETAIPESLTVMQLPADIRKRLRTTNGLEATNQEISDEWQFGKAYINIKEEAPTTA